MSLIIPFRRRIYRFVRGFLGRSRLHPLDMEFRRRMRMTLRDWLTYHQWHVLHDHCHWMGVRTLKNPLDAWILQEIIYETKPDVVVEIGSGEGGSTLYLAHLLELIGHGFVVSVDVDRTDYEVQHDRIVDVTGSSASPEVFRRVSTLCRDRSTLVMHDSGHREKQVLKDLRDYSSLVSVDSYFIVEDAIVDVMGSTDGVFALGRGPMAAIQQFLKEDPNFVVDTKRERYLLTYNPGGYLKRIR